MGGVRSIAVLVATFNRAAYLRECIDSLLAQTRPGDQIIVIDDGSADDTEIVARSYGEQLLYLRQVNSGKSIALNLGMEHVTSSHVCFFRR
jgi:glycosyltransferase involved in cell wall biosynthesis